MVPKIDWELLILRWNQRWHPDRCSSMEFVEEAKKKFQAIQEAYSGNFTSFFSQSLPQQLFSVPYCETDGDWLLDTVLFNVSD